MLFSPFFPVSLSTAERVRAREREGELTCQSSRSNGTEVWEILCSHDTPANARLWTAFIEGTRMQSGQNTGIIAYNPLLETLRGPAAGRTR